eukprot:m.93075 g.93075  ORF g.93075 m.93075 type:complete len:129 (-) comp13380_c0_seq4:75-461(-)
MYIFIMPIQAGFVHKMTPAWPTFERTCIFSFLARLFSDRGVSEVATGVDEAFGTPSMIGDPGSTDSSMAEGVNFQLSFKLSVGIEVESCLYQIGKFNKFHVTQAIAPGSIIEYKTFLRTQQCKHMHVH